MKNIAGLCIMLLLTTVPAAAITVQVSSFTAYPYSIPQGVAQCIVSNLTILSNRRSSGFELDEAGLEEPEGELDSALNDKTASSVRMVAAMTFPQRFQNMARLAFNNATNQCNFLNIADNCTYDSQYRLARNLAPPWNCRNFRKL